MAGLSSNIQPSFFGGGGTDNGGLGINWKKLEDGFFLFDLGVKHGFGAGVDSTIGFVKSLGTAKGWEDLGQGIVDLGHFANQFSSEGTIMRAQMGESVSNYVTNIPNMSAYEVGYDIGFTSEKISEILITRRVAPLPKSFLGVRNAFNSSRFTTIQSIRTYGKFGKFSKPLPTFPRGQTIDKAVFFNRNFVIPGGRFIGFGQLQYLQNQD